MTNTAEKIDTTSIQIPARKLREDERLSFLPKLAGHLMLQFENGIYTQMERLTNGAYTGGYWEFYEFPNGAMMMVYEDLTVVEVCQPSNYFEDEMSMMVLSIAMNLHLCSNLSFHPKAPAFLGKNYHLLMENLYGWADNGWPGVPAEFGKLIALLD